MWRFLSSHCLQRTLERSSLGGSRPDFLFAAEPPSCAVPTTTSCAVPTTTLLVKLPLFTAAWWVPPLPAVDCWSSLRNPVWRAGCPTRQIGGLAQPGAIWMWAIWTCDKNKSHGGEEDHVHKHKIKQPKGESMGRKREKKNAGHRKKLWWGKRWRRNKF